MKIEDNRNFYKFDEINEQDYFKVRKNGPFGKVVEDKTYMKIKEYNLVHCFDGFGNELDRDYCNAIDLGSGKLMKIGPDEEVEIIEVFTEEEISFNKSIKLRYLEDGDFYLNEGGAVFVKVRECFGGCKNIVVTMKAVLVLALASGVLFIRNGDEGVYPADFKMVEG